MVPCSQAGAIPHPTIEAAAHGPLGALDEAIIALLLPISTSEMSTLAKWSVGGSVRVIYPSISPIVNCH